MDKPLISIIMGIYNCQHTLKTAISSIESQTYDNWELIMCDDGSTDGTLQIAMEYQEKDPARFIVLRNERNNGLNYTLNRCLEIARGEYVARMDGDDLSKPTRLEQEIRFMKEHPEFALVSTAMEMFDENGVWGRTQVIERPQKEDFCLHTPFFCHAAVMMRTSVYREVGGYTVDPRLVRVEDCHLWFKVYAKGYKGANLPDVLYSMRNDRNAQSRRTFKARKNGIYVMWAGFRMLNMPWYKYYYVLRNAVRETIKCVTPQWAYDIAYKKHFGGHA